ncbi:MAG TPA: DUF5666 domain-containing protein [Gammaproteobacteria bacterium]
MKQRQLTIAIGVALATLGLAACSGGSSSSSSGNTTLPTSTISGTITGFGSVFVNGVEYDTTGASVQLDGTAGSETDLQVGMVVTVQGNTNANGLTGTANSISFADVAEGAVLAVNLNNGVGTLNVMGQTVQVTDLTIFESAVAGITLDTIPLNAIAEVSGYSDGNGTVYATRVEIKQAALQPGDILEVKGVVSNLGATTFQLGTLVVDYSGATQLPSNLADGLNVEVHGATAPTNNGGTYTFAASDVELVGDGHLAIKGDEGDTLKLQGVVMGVDSAASTLVINGQQMAVSSDAMRDGLTLADLTVGTYIKLEAEQSNGQWLVKEIEVGRSSDAELNSTIEAVDLTAGTITLMGQTISIDSSTLLQDEITQNPQHYFDIADLQVGDKVEVAVSFNAGQWLAAKLMREDAGGASVLEGKVTSLSPVQVAGITVSGLDTLNITPTLGMALKISGDWNGTQLSATAMVSQ